jgi:uncharacterized protein (TIGR03437 family)
MRLLLAISALRVFLAAAAIAADGSSYRISTIAGSDYVGDNGPATSALLFQADGITFDAAGHLYVSDAANHRIRMISRTGTITTVAGTGVAGYTGDGGPASAAQLNSPYGLAADGAGNLYVADLGNARVRRIAPDGTMTTVAGGGTMSAGGINDGIAATTAVLNAPRNLAWDSRGSLYISDFSGHRVYRLTPAASLVTVAGNGTPGFSGDGALATLAQLSYPAGLAVDQNGNVYIGDTGNHLIRKITGTKITSIARASASTGMTTDVFGTLYAADPVAAQMLTIPVGATAVAFPILAQDLCFGPDGYVYATDGSTVRRVSFAGPGKLIAGGGNFAYGDQGSALQARLNHPSGVTTGLNGAIYLADRDNHRIRHLATDGTITTVAADANGNVYIADTGNQRVCVLTSSGMLREVAVAGLASPANILPDGNGNIYVADSANGTILQVSAKGTTVVAANLKSPRGLALDGSGSLYFTEMDGKHVKRLDPSGTITALAEGAWSIPRSVAVDATGNVFVADTGLQAILRIDVSGAVTRIAGTGTAGFSGDGGDAASAELNFPWDIAIGPNGTLLIADLSNNRIRQLTPSITASSAPVTLITAVNAASLLPGPIAPGMLLDVFGSGISSVDAGQVLFNGIAGQILYADAMRVLVEAPPALMGQTGGTIQALNNGTVVGQIPVAIAAAAPALYINAPGQAMALNQDGTANSALNPAARGSIIVLYGTGEGVSGDPVNVTIGGYTADILYAGPVEGCPGLLQINARVPSGYVPPGDLNVIVTVGSASSQPGISVAVN